MHSIKALAIASLAILTAPAFAEDAKPTSPHTVTGNFSLTSQYVFRGMAQSDSKPAIQGGYDYAHASGFYAGVWASSASWVSDAGIGSNALEVDGYLGFKKTFLKDFTADLGVITYYYPGTYGAVPSGFAKPHTTEAYLGLSYKWVTLKYSHSLSDDFFGAPDCKNVKYYDATANVPLPAGLTLGLHAGRQQFPTSYKSASYNDYKMALSKEVIPTYTASLAYTYANSEKNGFWSNPLENNLGGSRVALTLTKAF